MSAPRMVSVFAARAGVAASAGGIARMVATTAARRDGFISLLLQQRDVSRAGACAGVLPSVKKLRSGGGGPAQDERGGHGDAERGPAGDHIGQQADHLLADPLQRL